LGSRVDIKNPPWMPLMTGLPWTKRFKWDGALSFRLFAL